MTAYAALELFKWRTDDPVSNEPYYNNGIDAWPGATNWWKLANDIGFYAALALWGVASLTQIASLAGVAADINIMVWFYGLGMVGALVSLVAGSLHFYAKWSAFGLSRDATQTAGVVNAAGGVYGSVSLEEVEHAAFGALVGMELAYNWPNWMAAQWAALPEEKRAEWEAQMEEEAKDKEDAMDQMLTLVGF